jgi:hypothetical protein
VGGRANGLGNVGYIYIVAARAIELERGQPERYHWAAGCADRLEASGLKSPA